MYPTKSDVETTAFAVALTREAWSRRPFPGARASREAPVVAPSIDQVSGVNGRKAPVPEPPDGASSDTFARRRLRLGTSSDGSVGNTICQFLHSVAAGSQNTPRLRSTDVSSQSGAAMDATKVHSAGLIGLAAGNTDRSTSGPINDSPMSSSNAMQPMESHEMHVSGAPKDRPDRADTRRCRAIGESSRRGTGGSNSGICSNQRSSNGSHAEA